jgi:hypothetical protein
MSEFMIRSSFLSTNGSIGKSCAPLMQFCLYICRRCYVNGVVKVSNRLIDVFRGCVVFDGSTHFIGNLCEVYSYFQVF